MMNPEALLALVTDHGLLVIALVSVVEGPLVSILGGSLAGAGLLPLPALVAVVVAGDMAGDIALYAIGRRGGRLLPRALRARVIERNAPLSARLQRSMQDHGARLLVAGKLTHAAGFAVLLAAGAARYPFGRFVVVNLAATVLKCAALVGLGWWLGDQWQRSEVWMERAALAAVVLILAAAALWLHHARRTV